MYADEIVLLLESASGLQKALFGVEKFCSSWGMNVNMKNTKILIFNTPGKLAISPLFNDYITAACTLFYWLHFG
jgi:hypothetical protein